MPHYRIDYTETCRWHVDIEAANPDEARDNFWERSGDLTEATEHGIDDTDILTITEVR